MMVLIPLAELAVLYIWTDIVHVISVLSFQYFSLSMSTLSGPFVHL